MAKCSFGHVKMLVFGIIIIKKLEIFVVRLLVFLNLAITVPEILENMTGRHCHGLLLCSYATCPQVSCVS